jgi:hypothetical protein
MNYLNNYGRMRRFGKKVEHGRILSRAPGALRHRTENEASVSPDPPEVWKKIWALFELFQDFNNGFNFRPSNRLLLFEIPADGDNPVDIHLREQGKLDLFPRLPINIDPRLTEHSFEDLHVFLSKGRPVRSKALSDPLSGSLGTSFLVHLEQTSTDIQL